MITEMIEAKAKLGAVIRIERDLRAARIKRSKIDLDIEFMERQLRSAIDDVDRAMRLSGKSDTTPNDTTQSING